ncbi:MAG: hypothetical protein HUU22_12490 [Phycisphaerae bacterium]|nr:hypothetical protein [Phycisphaerae bacterium]NUQ46837.1 hypothetical protein [Phycisphaerae bacterium]
MSLCVVHVTGPAASGKTELAAQLATRLHQEPTYFLRFVPQSDSASRQRNRLTHLPGAKQSLLHVYTPAKIFEQVPDALRDIKRNNRWATVLLETDTHPCHRQAYSYDVRVFVTAAPPDVHVVFRTPQETNAALRGILNDTCEFANEIYGLTPDMALDESRLGMVAGAATANEPNRIRSDRDPLSDTQVVELLSSTIGIELALRVQFQPDFECIACSDVVILNTTAGGRTDVVETVAGRIERMQPYIRRRQNRSVYLAVCDLSDPEDPIHQDAVAQVLQRIDAAKSDWPRA